MGATLAGGGMLGFTIPEPARIPRVEDDVFICDGVLEVAGVAVGAAGNAN